MPSIIRTVITLPLGTVTVEGAGEAAADGEEAAGDVRARAEWVRGGA